MASTNKTTNYDLSQYIGTDKPTYLTDYNQDMSKIDTGIHAAKSEADNNATSIGTLSNLTTTAKTDLVSAVNEIDGEVATNTNNIATNTSNIATNTTQIGTIANLTTTAKTDLVVAANEINAKVGNLSSLTTTNKNSTVGAINEIKSQINDFNLTSFVTPTLTITKTSDGTTAPVQVSNNNIKIAKNSNGSLFKIYGSVTFTNQQGGDEYKYRFSNTGLPAVDQAYTISNAALTFLEDGTTMNQRVRDITYETNGDLTFTYLIYSATKEFMYIPNCLYFNSNFGDVPTPE